jgi:hypothetical protein
VEQSIQKILSTIDDAIAQFQGAIPGIQKIVYDELQPIVKQLQVKNGKLLNNVDNLKLIGSLKSKLEKVIISAEYKDTVKKFVDSFSDVSNLNNDYFAQFNKKYKPKNTLPIIKELAVGSTINSLIGQGLNSNVIAPIEKILQQNITTGGSYAAFQDVLRNHILTNETGEGNLQRYTKQITTDAIHQYNAQYAETIAQDLQFNWGRYVGSNITTSREFCIYLRKKQWVHKSELTAIIEGNIDGHECKLSNTTGLPVGLIPDTNADNFKVRRGGYNCGDQFFWLPDSAVPADVRTRFENPVPKVVNAGLIPLAQKVVKQNKTTLNEIADKGYSIDETLLNYLGDEISIHTSSVYNAYYNPLSKQIVVGDMADRLTSKYFKDTLMPHEIGHAIHNTKGIINRGVVNDEFKVHFTELKQIIKGKELDINNAILSKRFGATQNEAEQLCVIADILGSLTKGKYGYGHTVQYYKTSTKPEAEIFAHGISLMKVENDFATLTPEIKEIIKKMIAYSKGL